MILARMRRTITERGLIDPGMRVLVACSGGPDSSALLAALARLSPELGFGLEAASVDHGLRASAGADVQIARELAGQLGVAFHALRVQVEPRASLQAAARDARYRALLQLATHIGAQRVAVGHTQDDQAETVLLRMLRGAGLAGLSAIAPLRADGVIRPLLDCRRSAVAAFATRHCGRIAHDASNRDPRFGRSRVRADVLPGLEREDVAIVQHLADLADDARACADALRPLSEALLARSLQGNDIIDVSSWDSVPRAIRRGALRMWLARATGREPRRSQLAEIDHATVASAEIWLAGGFKVHSTGGGTLRLVAAATGDTHP